MLLLLLLLSGVVLLVLTPSLLLLQHFFWRGTWKAEKRMELALPSRADTNGSLLATQASHALVLDMITRTGEEAWPRYGTNPGYNQQGIGANGTCCWWCWRCSWCCWCLCCCCRCR